jgi:hypothetical protein
MGWNDVVGPRRGLNNAVFALAASDGEIYAGGAFTGASVVNARYVARWDGTNWSALGSGADSAVEALVSSGPTCSWECLPRRAAIAAGFTIHTGVSRIPRVTRFGVSGADSVIRFTTAPWQTYAVEHKPNGEGGWVTLAGGIAGDGGTNAVIHRRATLSNDFIASRLSCRRWRNLEKET